MDRWIAGRILLSSCDLCNDIPIYKISLKSFVPHGAVENLAQPCHGFSTGMVKFGERMGRGMLAKVMVIWSMDGVLS